jgi:hypothetical protein
MKTVNRMWFVIPSDIKGDGRTWLGPNAVTTNGDFGEAPQPARPRERAPRNVDPEPTIDPGHGFYLLTKEAKEIVAFTTKGKAEEYAKHLATMNPQKLFGVYECGQLFETTVPEVLEKKFNDAGELVLNTRS